MAPAENTRVACRQAPFVRSVAAPIEVENCSGLPCDVLFQGSGMIPEHEAFHATMEPGKAEE